MVYTGTKDGNHGFFAVIQDPPIYMNLRYLCTLERGVEERSEGKGKARASSVTSTSGLN